MFSDNFGMISFDVGPENIYMLSGQEHLKEIILPDTIKHLDENAFKGCTYLNSVEFGQTSSITIGPRAFKGCTNLLHLEVYGNLTLQGNALGTNIKTLCVKGKLDFGCNEEEVCIAAQNLSI